VRQLVIAELTVDRHVLVPLPGKAAGDDRARGLAVAAPRPSAGVVEPLHVIALLVVAGEVGEVELDGWQADPDVGGVVGGGTAIAVAARSAAGRSAPGSLQVASIVSYDVGGGSRIAACPSGRG
jgi:hypothetical protein